MNSDYPNIQSGTEIEQIRVMTEVASRPTIYDRTNSTFTGVKTQAYLQREEKFSTLSQTEREFIKRASMKKDDSAKVMLANGSNSCKNKAYNQSYLTHQELIR